MMSWKYYVVIPEVDLYCDVVGILWALYLKLLCGEMLGIWMVLYVARCWRKYTALNQKF
ncbi:hypothetical protein SIAG_01147 [Staphylococcus aureus subsp. aureus EMRSA16]|nr:hypothetical protein SIAG_01147 [Staphylococcus aureus subsp. aureus EMRSA16]